MTGMKPMSLRKFGRTVERVLKTLPAELHQYLENVVVDVEEEPDEKTLRQTFTDEEIAEGACMYGLFSPLPLAGTEGMDFDEPPHRLIIYQRPLEEDFPERRQLMIEIRKTVIHELAHHFGFTDQDLEKFDDTPDPFAERLIEKETTVHLARFRLASLWLSQTARITADNCLRVFVLLLVAGNGQAAREAAWYQVTIAFILPFIVFAPINGAIANGLPKRGVLVGAGAYSLALVGLLAAWLPATPDTAWWWCLGLGLNMLGFVVYSPARYALLPAVSQDARVPLPRVNGWIEMGCSVGVVGGLLLGASLATESWPAGIPAAMTVVFLLTLLSLVAALPIRFASDVVRPEPPGQAIVDFFRDCGRVWARPEAHGSLLGLAGLMALVFTGTGAILAHKGVLAPDADRHLLQECMILLAVGAAAGSLAASLQGHPYRTLGLVPLGICGLFAALIWVLTGSDPRSPILLLGFTAGLANVPLRAVYQATVPADARGNALAVSNMTNYLLQFALGAVLYVLVRADVLTKDGQVIVVVTLTAISAAAACWVLRRPAFEQVSELLLWPMYRFRTYGPGAGKVPANGPVLVIANHTAWFDPLWIAKVLPRHIVPLMTSDFYDLPGLRWLMKHIIGAIRVQTSTFRREAPELQKAIKLLDKGECVVLFPEGRLRRTEEPTVRQFGRGAWLILSQRPQTPVVVCWIEGGWGCFVSYYNGKPTKNKRLDFWRHIDIAISEPEVLAPELLADIRKTRTYLMRACLNARGYLGLEVPVLEEREDEEVEKDDPALATQDRVEKTENDGPRQAASDQQ
jgi:1-acyl-sn-glycerol-3-phosphate acyltransferase